MTHLSALSIAVLVVSLAGTDGTGAELLAEVKGKGQFLAHRTDHVPHVSSLVFMNEAISEISALFRAPRS